jgi:hypothetical protein
MGKQSTVAYSGSFGRRKKTTMWHIANPFSAWVLPLRMIGIAVLLYAFVRMLAAPDLTLLVFAIVGSLLWQAGTAVEEHSPLYRRLASATIKDIMRNQPVMVRSWMSVGRLRSEHPDLPPNVFMITTQNGYNAGILTPEELSRVPDEMAQYTSLAQLAHPLGYVHALRLEDPVLEAFLRFRKSDDALLPVLDRREALAGVVTREDADRWLNKGAYEGRRLPANTETGAEKKLAA